MQDAAGAKSKKEVEDFYNNFKEHQKSLGINIRHRTIYGYLKALGLSENSNVLEVGCGIGTVSKLILQTVKKGKFVGVDISSESINLAKQFNRSAKNAVFLVDDMSAFSSETRFDYIVLPDVLEHIPQEAHANLFKVLGSVSASKATVLINIPEPICLNWMRENYPEKLQIIDQSLSVKDLLNDCYPAGFTLHSVRPYSLQYNEPDYLSIVLLKGYSPKQYHTKNKLTLFVENVRSKLRLAWWR